MPLGAIVRLVGKHVTQWQPPLIADHPRRKQTVVDQADDEGARDVQDCGRLLRRDVGLDSHQRHGLARSRFLENVHQKARNDRRQIERRRLMSGGLNSHAQRPIERLASFKRATRCLGELRVVVGGNNEVDARSRHG